MRIAVLLMSTVMLLAQASGSGAAQESQTELLVQGQAVLNRSINIPAKDRTGEIVDLMIDPATGHIGFALLSFSGFMGLVEKNVIAPIPWDRVEFEPKQKTFVARDVGPGKDGGDIVEYDEDKWQVFDESELASLYKSYSLKNRAREVREAYAEVARTGAKATGEPLNMLQFTRLLNAPVMSREGALLGHVDKLYLDLTGGLVRLADVRPPGDQLELPAHLVPYPLLDYDWGSGRFTLDVSRDDRARLEDYPAHVGMYVRDQTMRQIYQEMGLTKYLQVGG